MLLNELEKLIEQNTLVSISRDDVDAEQLTGHVIQVSERLIVMRLCTDEGKFDGFTLFPLDQITEVCWGNREHRCISVLVEEKVASIPKLNLSSFESALSDLGERFKALAFMENGNERKFYVASVTAIDGDWIKLECLGTKKTLSNLTKIISTTGFSRIEFDSPYIRNCVSLHLKKSQGELE